MDHERPPISFRIRQWLGRIAHWLDLSRPVDWLLVKHQQRQELKHWRRENEEDDGSPGLATKSSPSTAEMSPEPVPVSIKITRGLERLPAMLDLGKPVEALIGRRQERQERKRWQREQERNETGDTKTPPGAFGAWLRRWWLRCSLLGLLIAAVVCFRPAMAWFKDWRTDQLLERAQAELERGDWPAAEQTARTVLQTRKGSIPALMVLFQAHRAQGIPRAVESAWWLSGQSGLSDDQRFEILNFLVESAPQGAFLTSFALQPDGIREAARYRSLYIRFLTRRGEFEAAARELAEAPDRDSAPALLLESARLGCKKGTPEGIGEARRCFLKLKDGHESESLAVLHLLAEVPQGLMPGSAGGFPQIDEWLEGLTTATVEDQLLASDQSIAAGGPSDKILKSVVSRFGDRYPDAVVRWMNRHGRHENVMPFVARLAKNDPALFVPVFEAQLALRLYDVAGLTLASPPQAFDPVDLAFLRLRLAAASGSATDLPWQEALSAVTADKKRNRGFELASLATATGRPEDKENATVIAFRHPGGLLPLFSDLAELSASLAAQDRLPDLIAILFNLARFEGSNAHLRKNLIYLQCLNGDVKPADAIPLLRALCAQESEDVYVRALAFVLLMAGQATEAVTLVEPIERRTGNDRSLEATLGTALKRDGKPDKASRFLNRIEWGAGHMLPAEERFLQRLLAAAPVNQPAEGEAKEPAGPKSN